MSSRKRRKPDSKAAPPAVQREWLRRVEAEYRSAAITAELTHALIELGAPPALIREGLRIVRDELAHAELSHAVYRASGGTDAPAMARESLRIGRRHPRLEHDVLYVAVQVFCLGETAAVRLFHRLRSRASVPSARKALDRVLRDEVRHRDFGWALLSWLLTLPNASELRALVVAALPQLIAQLVASYGGFADGAREGDAPEFADGARAYGLMPVAEYRAAVALCIERDLRPRFARLGFEIG
jgi:hypothetical protein